MEAVDSGWVCGGLLDVPIRKRETYAEVGTASSGDRNHPGRKGQVGGSAPSGLTKNEKNAITIYKADGYDRINAFLRGTKPTLGIEFGHNRYGPIETYVKDLDAIMQKSKLASDTVVYRGLSARALDPNFQSLGRGDFRAENKSFDWMKTEGMTFKDKGFVSTSTDELIAGQYSDIVAEIHAPAGTHAFTFADQNEHEILLDRGLSFHIDSVEMRQQGRSRSKVPYLKVSIV